MGPGNVQEATPLVYNGVMYLPNPSDLVQARRQDGRSALAIPAQAARDLGKFMPVFAINRNLAIYGDKIVEHERRRLRLRLGREDRRARVGDEDPRLKGAQQTSGPIIANGKIISGRGCEPEGGPDACVITAHARSPAKIWRTRTIKRPGEPGYETWGDVPEEKRIHVGTWMVPSYDPQLNMVYIGIRHLARAEIHAGRQHKRYLPQLDAGLERRHGQDR